MPRLPDAAARTRVLDAARQLLVERGEDFTLDELAQTSGVSRTTIYRRFGDRNAVLLAAREADDALLASENGSRDMRTRILDAADSEFSERGLRAATIERIARRAGVGPATIYRRFGDKESLIHAFLEERSPRRTAWSLAISGGADLEADLTRLAHEMLEYLWDHQGLVRLMWSPDPETTRLLESVHQRSRGFRRGLAAYLTRHMDAGRMPRTDSMALAHAFVGLLLVFGMRRAEPDDEHNDNPASNLDSTARFITRLFLDGCRTAPE